MAYAARRSPFPGRTHESWLPTHLPNSVRMALADCPGGSNGNGADACERVTEAINIFGTWRVHCGDRRYKMWQEPYTASDGAVPQEEIQVEDRGYRLITAEPVRRYKSIELTDTEARVLWQHSEAELRWDICALHLPRDG